MSAAGRARFDQLEQAARRRLAAWALVRSFVTGVLVIVGYYLMPFDGVLGERAIVDLVLGIGLFVGVLFWQVRRISRADHPQLVALEAVGVIIPLVIVVFSSVYLVLGHNAPGSFSETLTKSSTLYFTLTVLSTVGFGDIVAKTDGARLAVAVQMLIDLILLGVIARVLLGAAQNAVARQREAAAPPLPAPAGPAQPVPPASPVPPRPTT